MPARVTEPLLLELVLPLCSLSSTERRSLVRVALPLIRAAAGLLAVVGLAAAVLSEVEVVDTAGAWAAAICDWMACCWARVVLVTVSDTMFLPPEMAEKN